MQRCVPITAALCSTFLVLAGCDRAPPTSPDQPAPTPNPSVVPCPATGHCGEPLEPDVTAIGKAPMSSSMSSTAWVVGDLFAGVGGGVYKVFDNAGNFKEQISNGLGGFTTGCAFNPTLDKLYTTDFSATKVIV